MFDHSGHRLSFWLRDRLIGKLRLRGGLPPPRGSAQELAFYQLLLREIGVASLPWTEQPGAVWDVGCRDGAYLPALVQTFKQARLTGVELDLGRRYWNGFRRLDQAQAQAAALRAQGRSAAIEWADFGTYQGLQLAPEEEWGMVTYFFPFVSPDPCRAWGLPVEKNADFAHWLVPLREARARGGGRRFGFLSVHQGEWEAEAASRAYAQMDWLSTPVERRLRGRIPAEKWRGLWPLKWDAFWFLVLPDG